MTSAPVRASSAPGLMAGVMATLLVGSLREPVANITIEAR